MNWLEFWSSIAQSVAWPAVVLVVVVVLRKAIAGALSSIASGVNEFTAEFFGQKFKVSRQIEVAKEVADDVGLPPVRVSVELPPEPLGDRQREGRGSPSAIGIDDIDPDADPDVIVMSSWYVLEHQLRRLAGTMRPTAPVGDVIRAVGSSDLLNREILEVVYRLRRIRNDVVHHEARVTRGEAVEFYFLTRRVLDALRESEAGQS